MNEKEREELDALYARMEDLCLRAEKGEAVVSSFLSPREHHYACGYLDRRGAQYASLGGFAGAERKRLCLLPDYVDLSAELLRDAERERECMEALALYGVSCEICGLRIAGSGYRELTHRDFLGSLLGLGIERSVLGDIVVEADGTSVCAVVACDERIRMFIESELQRVGNDKVRITPVELATYTPPRREYTPIHDTVASERLDCVVAALCNLSREKARAAVCGGLVELNFESEERPDRTVTPPALISVRGFGRYRVLALTDRTRKGRIRLEAEQFR